MKINALHKSITSYYVPDTINDMPGNIEFLPLDGFTYVHLPNDETYTLPWGITQYDLLNDMLNKDAEAFDSLFEHTITGIGTSKWSEEINHTATIKNVQVVANPEDSPFVVLLEMLKKHNDMDHNGYNNIIHYLAQDYEDSKVIVKMAESLEVRELKPYLYELLAVFKDFVKQMVDSGVVASFKDPQAMLNAYRGGNK